MNPIQKMHFNTAKENLFNEGKLSDAINDLLAPEFEHFFLLGGHEIASVMDNLLHTLEANINNDKLSDAQYRKFTHTVFQAMRNCVDNARVD